MKTIISTIIVLFLLVYISGLKISMNPFSVKMENWPILVAMVGLIIFVSSIGYIFYNRGAIDALNEVIETLDKEIESNKNLNHEIQRLEISTSPGENAGNVNG
jgi:Tfp pilus assembly protein PilN